jgi:hypothetical protein
MPAWADPAGTAIRVQAHLGWPGLSAGTATSSPLCRPLGPIL